MRSDQLSGVRVAVTGATGGIGRELVLALVALGAVVAATGTSEERLTELRGSHDGLLTYAADITSEADVAGFFHEIGTRWGGVDAVINLAGTSIPGKIEEMPAADFLKMLEVNVMGTFLACKYAIPLLTDNKGLVINVSSLAGSRPNATAPGYCTAKAAVSMFSDALGLQIKDRNLRVSNLSPGGADTPFWGDRPVKREALMSPADVVSAILFVLATPPHVVVRELSFESTGLPH
ncbi:SDR family oxidoreductase [Arthrobacter sp. YN]|uniref:SDR family oxidoreductase n=1 Tax=Arthrobacter sp. YN TaxID=2020486 RepID=UPI0012FD7342|nr:SDR family oxidoreductase [Arthrobacter sp. YN]